MNSIRYSRRRRGRGVELNMAPLIDMIFILLIFFLVTTNFVRESGVDVQRPTAATASVKDKAGMVIGVTEAGSVHIAGRPVDLRLVRAHVERFLAETPGGSVVIAADRDSRTGTVITVLDACRLAGAANVSVAARRPQ
ncbi:biopolymer transport protein ExbD [Desulfobaculum xiamenense]|uniref:Biopolymer transport protein ExbD n=1 Tax=Desulfobaculum xiamenense TaxID=995050 RepID=A0A846QK06_9BACT|nr:biopolymer transporter ExbD [Desulfobaculum xiamenense]NJB68538.1 biopolymer transport protein ExbD [Desulfobaculum xiamenense]